MFTANDLIRILVIALFLLVAAIAVPTTTRLTAGELNQKNLDQLLAKLTPPTGECWRSIPWTISVLDAQRKAARERKPIFIWAMDGHPLGCT